VAGAPEAEGFARMDDGSQDAETMWLTGQVRDVDGTPMAGAKVEIWHANSKGGYSFFDPTQSEYNLRRTIKTDARAATPRAASSPPATACRKAPPPTWC
jgi:catechol 1,2-dioxygenase